MTEICVMNNKREVSMNKYVNFKIAIDGESVNMYIETGGEPIHIVYWTEDEWLEDAESAPSTSRHRIGHDKKLPKAPHRMLPRTKRQCVHQNRKAVR